MPRPTSERHRRREGAILAAAVHTAVAVPPTPRVPSETTPIPQRRVVTPFRAAAGAATGRLVKVRPLRAVTSTQIPTKGAVERALVPASRVPRKTGSAGA